MKKSISSGHRSWWGGGYNERGYTALYDIMERFCYFSVTLFPEDEQEAKENYPREFVVVIITNKNHFKSRFLSSAALAKVSQLRVDKFE